MTVDIDPGSLVERLCAHASGRPCVAIVEDEHRTDLRWARSTMTTNGDARTREVTVIAVDPRTGGTGVAALGATRPADEDLSALVDRAFAIARDSPDAEDAAPLLTGSGVPDPDAHWHDPAAAGTAGSLAGVVTGLGRAFAEAPGLGMSLFGYAEQSVSTTTLGSTSGLRHRHVQHQGRVEVTARSADGARSSWWGRSVDSFDPTTGPEDIADAVGELARALRRQQTRVDIAPGRHEVILSPGAVGDFMVDLWWSATARDALDGHSAFSAPGGGTRIGAPLSARDLTLVSDPHSDTVPCDDILVVGASSPHASVFDNGASLGAVTWIDSGRLAHLMAPRALAEAHDLPFVASPDSLTLVDRQGTGDLDDLVARTESALLVTCVWYTRLVDPRTMLLTGLTRDGVYVVRDGEIVGAAGNFRFNESPVGILGRVLDATGTSRTLPREMGDYAPRVAMPALRIAELNLSTRSEAQ